MYPVPMSSISASTGPLVDPWSSRRVLSAIVAVQDGLVGEREAHGHGDVGGAGAVEAVLEAEREVRAVMTRSGR